MIAQKTRPSTFHPCKTCGTADRYTSGHCIKCKNDNRHKPKAPARKSPGDLILDCLPGDNNHIMRETGLSKSAVRVWQIKLREAGDIHIGSYESRAGRPVPTYVCGWGEDAPYPTPLRARAKKVKAALKKKRPKAEWISPKRPKRVIVNLTVREAMDKIEKRLAARKSAFKGEKLTDAAVMRSRAAFPLSAVWG